MEKLLKKLDEIFDKYGVSDDERADVAEIVDNIAGGELVVEGEEFNAPDMGEVYGEEEDVEYED